MNISKSQLITFGIIIFIFVLFGLIIKFPLAAIESEKQTLFQSATIIEILIMLVGISILYFLFIQFFPTKDFVEQIKSYRKPLLNLQKEKFDYWLKSELYALELDHEQHRELMHEFETQRALNNIEVLKKAAELNDMRIDTYVKALKAQAESNLINAKSEIEKAKASILLKAVKILPNMSPMWQAYIISCITDNESDINKDLELQKEIDQIIKNKSNEELRAMKLENDNKEEKFNRNKKPKDGI